MSVRGNMEHCAAMFGPCQTKDIAAMEVVTELMPGALHGVSRLPAPVWQGFAPTVASVPPPSLPGAGGTSGSGSGASATGCGTIEGGGSGGTSATSGTSEGGASSAYAVCGARGARAGRACLRMVQSRHM